MLKKFCLGVLFSFICITRGHCFWSAPSDNSWTGFYIGGNLGGCDHTFSIFDIDYDWFGGTIDLRNQNFLGGLQIGYNYQFCQAVCGLEACFDWVSTKNTFRNYSGNLIGITAKLERFSTIHARIGLNCDGFLLYFLGGAAYEKVSGSWNNPASGTWPDLGKNLWGWTFGGGVEKSIFSHFSLRAQVMSLQFFDFTRTSSNNNKRFILNNNTLVGLVGVNYRFCL